MSGSPSATHSGKRKAAHVTRTPSLRTALIIFVSVLILFRWLHLILALQITSTGRQIQASTQLLQRMERETTALQAAIAEAESPVTLAAAARRLGYQPQPLRYIHLDVPLAAPTEMEPDDSVSGLEWMSSPGRIGLPGGPALDTSLP